MKNIFRIVMSLLVFAGLASCKEPAPEQQSVKFAVYDDSGETPRSVDFIAKGKKGYSLKVMSNADWTLTVAEGSEWITASPLSGKSGMRPVTIDVAANEDTAPRSGRIDFACGNIKISITLNQAGGDKVDPVPVPPIPSNAPVADLLDVVFKNDGTAIDNSEHQNEVQYVSGASSVNYFNDTYQRYTSHFNHKLGGEMAGGYYKVDYTNDAAFRSALSDGHTLEVVFRMDQRPNGSEIKPFSSMQAGGTGFLITDTNKGTDITFLPNVSTNGKSTWKWAQSGVVPEPGRYYHVVGVWNKETGKASVYVDGVLKNEIAAEGNLNFPTAGNTWFCVGGDPSGNGAHAGFNGDVVVARVYDDPLKAADVAELYKLVKNDVKTDVIAISDVAYLPAASVAKGCWYYIYSSGFQNGDVLILEAITGSRQYECETVYADGSLKLQIPDNFVAGKYRIIVKRGGNVAPVGYADLKVVSSIQQINRTQIVAHRGYHPGSVPENSLASLIEAQKLGVYGSEFDVYITTDDVVVLYHDNTLKGTEHPDNASLKGKRVDSVTYDELRNYKMSDGSPLPTLNQYLEQGLKYPNTKLILEIKTHNSTEKNMRVTEACFNAVKNKNMQDQVEYIAFNYDICKKLVSLDPNAMVQYLNGDKDPATVLKDGIRGIDYSSSKLTDAWIKQANDLGMTVNVWTVNAESAMLDFMNKGVDLITTDEAEKAMKLVGKPFVSAE